MAYIKKIFIYVVFFVIGIGCSASKNVSKQNNTIATLDSGLVLEDIGEEGVAELVLPEMLTYADLKNKIEKRENLEQMELGSVIETKNNSEISIIINDEIDKEFIKKNVEKIEKKIPVTTTEVNNPPALRDSFYQEYVVQKNDSLMLISYKFFRDFTRWHDIREWNKESLNEKNHLLEGQKLKIVVKDYKGDDWQGVGNPYLIRRGDYLSRISQKIYNGKSKYWVHIWANNNLLIRNPNKIYAGFTIYTPLIEDIITQPRTKHKTFAREVSSEIK